MAHPVPVEREADRCWLQLVRCGPRRPVTYAFDWYPQSTLYNPPNTWFNATDQYLNTRHEDVSFGGGLRHPIYECPSMQNLGTSVNYGHMGVMIVDYGVPSDQWKLSPVVPSALFMSSHDLEGNARTSASLSDVDNPSSAFMAMDSTVDDRRGGKTRISPHAYIVPPYRPDGKTLYPLDFDGDGFLDSNKSWYQWWAPYNNTDMRHGKGLNALYVDGHAANVSLTEWARREHWAWLK